MMTLLKNGFESVALRRTEKKERKKERVEGKDFN